MAGVLRIPPVPRDMDAIGGYFSLEPEANGLPTFHSAGHSFQSGRAAFLALLEAVKPRRVWLPWYLCDSMSEPLEQARVEIQRYALNPDFSVDLDVELQPDELLLAVNYFGLLDDAMDRVLSRYPASQVVIDNSQAFYSAPRKALANVYSPRKLVGVADGGYLVTDRVSLPEYPEDAGSVARSKYLLKRRDFGAEAGYADFSAAETGFSGLPPMRMSELTRAHLQRVDHAALQRRRRLNFELLNARLGRFNQLEWTLGNGSVPLCYPFVARHAEIRAALWAARIYAPCYWPELLDERRQVPELERGWARELLALPVDQRYEPDTLERYLVLPLLGLLQT